MESEARAAYSIAERLTSSAKRHQKKLWVAGVAVVLYSALGFFAVPWLVEKLATDAVSTRYAAKLSIDRVAFNPYVLGLRIDRLAMQDPDGKPLAGAQQVYLNLQLSSLIRFAPTFAEIRLTEPEVHLARSADGGLNTAFLAPPAGSDPAPEPEPGQAQLPRLVVHELIVSDAALHWRDAVPPRPVETTLGPVNVAVRNLSTLPQREGQQDVVITTETSGTLSWSGTLQLNPLRSTGHAQILGSHVALVSAYIRDAIGFELDRGHADVGFDYVVDMAADGNLIVEVDNFEFALGDVLVRTFGSVTAEGSANDRDVLIVPEFGIHGGAMRWPEKTVTISDVTLNDSKLAIHRDSTGVVNIAPRRNGTEAPAEPDQPGPAAGSDWHVSLGRFAINGMAIDLTDDSLQPQAQTGVADLTLEITDISTAAGARFPTEVSIVTRTGGAVSVSGAFGVLPRAVAELSIRVEGLSLAESNPYLKPLADISLDSGEIGLDASVSSGPDDPLQFMGDIAITDFLVTETDGGSRLGSWDRLALDQVVASLGARKVEVSEVRFEKPYADVFVAEDGSVNLGRIEPGEQVPADAGDAQPEPAQPASDTPSAVSPFEITIGRIVISEAAADFADFSLPLPFEAGIAELSGELTTVATASTEPSKVDMEGKVDDFGLLRVAGAITPLDVKRNTDIQLHFQNVEIPKFSAYTVAFAGREIASGKLDLDLGYKVTDSQLVGENRVVLRDFMLGDVVEHPGATSLPLGLAVALLTGPDGTIDIDLPVRGDVDDPEFGYGRVVGKALVNLIVKVAASPFALLGKLVGAEADELDHISFFAGRSDLTPPEQERIGKIAEALRLRPELVLEINGVVDREADGLALRTARLDELIETRIVAATESGASDAMYAARRTDVIEALYREAGTAESIVLEELKARFTTPATDPESGRTTSYFDELAYTAELRRRLIDRQVVAEEELIAVARARVDNVRAVLVQANSALEDRIRTGQVQAAEAGEDGSVHMEITLTSKS